MIGWAERIARYRLDPKPWLIVPDAPERRAEHRAISYGDLHRATCHAAAAMEALSPHPPQRLLVVADNSPESCVCILAGLALGWTIVAIAPPSVGQTPLQWNERIARHAAECSPALVTGPDHCVRELRHLPEVSSASFGQLVSWVGVEDTLATPRVVQDAALWQYTSGTTGSAKIAQIGHANLFHNLEAIGERISVCASDINTIWLPLFHDMGLIGSLLFATHFHITGVLMSPRMFAARPESWLWAISRFGVTCSAAPNVAYEICASKVDESRLKGLDLSSWRVAFNGAERVHRSTIERFCARFSGYGFRRSAIYPVYGLAEHTLAAAMPRELTGPKFDWVDGRELDTHGVAVPAEPDGAGAQAVTSVGCALPGHEVHIVDAGGVVQDERKVGEIALRGPSRMLGYRAASGQGAPESFLRTGDLGYLANGELHVVGRKKHLIKRGGRGISAELIEDCVRSIACVRGVVAAFGAPDEQTATERVVVLVESHVTDATEQVRLQGEITRAVRAATDCVPDAVHLVAPGSIPRTTSGKVRHAAARTSYLEGALRS